MKTKKILAVQAVLQQLVDDLNQIKLVEEEESRSSLSRLNLEQYLRLRKQDLTDLQVKLGKLGFSRLARAEGNVLHAIHQQRKIVHQLLNWPSPAKPHAYPTKRMAQKLLAKNTKRLLGRKSKAKRVRVMVTMPSEASENYQLVDQLVKQGMNCARINCAHDEPVVWKKIINNVKKASEKYQRKVSIAMDLAGPKIRTLEVEPESSQVLNVSPKRSKFGQVEKPGKLELAGSLNEIKDGTGLVVDPQFIRPIEIGEEIKIVDARKKVRILKVVLVENQKVTVTCAQTIYVTPGCQLVRKANQQKTKVKSLVGANAYLSVNPGDQLLLKISGHATSAKFDSNGKLIKPASITCTYPGLINDLGINDKILFDDGKIEAKVMDKNTEACLVQIVRCKPGGAKLKPDKGINLPDSNLSISGLTEKDKSDLEFVITHADIVNFSFVNRVEDLEELFELLETHGNHSIGVILKIETKTAFNNLYNLLNFALKKENPIGVMVARGDLAVEVGWSQLGRVQSEITKICLAAHIPIIWATQVLENYAKSGIPTRAEISDIEQALRAECIMLNKGPFIVETLSFLNNFLITEEKYRNKNESLLPVIEVL